MGLPRVKRSLVMEPSSLRGLRGALLATVALARVAHADPPCAEPPEVRCVVHRESTQSFPPDPAFPMTRSSEVAISTVRDVDLDGDGTRDAIVPEPLAGECPQTAHYALYLVRNGCARRVGVVSGAVEFASLTSAPRSHGLVVVTTVSEVQRQPDPRRPAELVRTTRRWRYDGTVYREASVASEARVCHHCPRVRCESRCEVVRRQS